MRTLLVLAKHPEVPEGLRAALDPARYRIIHRLDLNEAEPFLKQGFADGCILDVASSDVRGIWVVERLRRAIRGPLLLVVQSLPWEWEEEAYVSGVAHVLCKPLKARLVNAVLDRVWTVVPPEPLHIQRSGTVFRAELPPPMEPAGQSPIRALEVLRDFSAVLTHSLQAEALLKQFLLLLREIIGVNRAAIFLRRPDPGFATVTDGGEPRRFRSACSIGLSPGLLEHFELSFESGIGGYLFRHGRILRSESEAALRDGEIQKEFELLGAQVAIPMLDRETLVGVAAFDERVTGDALGNGELELIFHLLEELGLAVKNIWLHDQLAASHGMMAGILRELSSACILINRDLAILHANKRANTFFRRTARAGEQIDFSDLPQAIGTKAYQVLQTGTGQLPFKYRPPGEEGKVYRVTMVPFQKETTSLPSSVLVVVEDQTQSEQLQQLEVEAANLRLIRSMAGRLAHEVGNSLVPLRTHQQLLKGKYDDPEFRESLDTTLEKGVKRIARLASQMRFLARDRIEERDAFPLAQLLEEAYGDAQQHHPGRATRLKCDAGSQPIILSGDRAALKHALAEVMLNALQADGDGGKVGVRFRSTSDASGAGWVEIEIQDTGPGVSAEQAVEVLEPFITNRNVGLGLGLTVSRRIIESHGGRLVVVPSENARSGGVQITLPLDAMGRAAEG